MKKIFKLLALIAFALPTKAQITIDVNDMPIAGDSVIRYNPSATTGLNFTQTGANFTWDFTTMLGNTKNVEKHFDITQAPLLAQLTFGPFANANLKSQIFKDGQSPLNTGGGTAGSFINVDSTFEFYKKTTSRFARTGYTIRLNGIDLPLPYDSNDVIYRLPLNFGNVDSNLSVFEINSPFLSFLYYKTRQKRVNTVDGWGSLKLPNTVSYDVLRVKSELYITDTIHIDTGIVNFGFPLNRPKSIEYKWLAKGKQTPVLQVVGNEIGGTFTPTTILFDWQVFAAIQSNNNSNELSVYPNPTNSQLFLNSKYNGLAYLCNINGSIISTNSYTANSTQTINVSTLPKASYILLCINDNGSIHKQIIAKQ
jgi:hypothetical protein